MSYVMFMLGVSLCDVYGYLEFWIRSFLQLLLPELSGLHVQSSVN